MAHVEHLQDVEATELVRQREAQHVKGVERLLALHTKERLAVLCEELLGVVPREVRTITHHACTDINW